MPADRMAAIRPSETQSGMLSRKSYASHHFSNKIKKIYAFGPVSVRSEALQGHCNIFHSFINELPEFWPNRAKDLHGTGLVQKAGPISTSVRSY